MFVKIVEIKNYIFRSHRLKKDFETCVLTSDPECVYNQGVRREGIGDHRRQTLFFCGHEPECT